MFYPSPLVVWLDVSKHFQLPKILQFSKQIIYNLEENFAQIHLPRAIMSNTA